MNGYYFIAGDIVKVRKVREKNVYDGVIVDVKDSTKNIVVIVVSFARQFGVDFNQNATYTVQFFPNRNPYIRMHKAIDRVISIYDEESLFPSKFIFSSQPQLDVEIVDGNLITKNNAMIQWSNAVLNSAQKIAVKSVLRHDCSNIPFIINGPPGEHHQIGSK